MREKADGVANQSPTQLPPEQLLSWLYICGCGAWETRGPGPPGLALPPVLAW